MANVVREARVQSEEEPSDAVPESGSGNGGDRPAPQSAPPASQPPSDIPAQPIYAQVSSVGDSATAVDELGFELYVNALADFLVAPNTHAPLTCSIEGSWGSGKSSFMLQLRNRLKTVAPNSRTVEFNAWKYDKQEELWAAFALKVTRSLREQLRWADRLRSDFRLFRTRIKGWHERLSILALALVWFLLLCVCGGVIAWTIAATHHERVGFIRSLVDTKEKPAATVPGSAPPSEQTSSRLPSPWYDWLAYSPLATSLVLIVLLASRIPANLRKWLFEAQLEKYIDRPDYKGKAAFVDSFSEDFSKMIEAYAPANGKIFVFIDDLDRCEAPKAADLMQAINLMIGDGNSLIFILGLDRAKVAAAIAFKFREIIPYLDPSLDLTHHPEGIRSFGDSFLEKFVQLSFRLPISSNTAQARKFIDSLVADDNRGASAPATPPPPTAEESAQAAEASARRANRLESGAESQRIRDVVMMVREVLEYSPRRIKTFLNAFRLALYIASAQGLLDVDQRTGEAEVTPERLGKFLVLTTRYPEFRPIVDRDSAFLRRLENLALSGEPDANELYRAWLDKPGVRRLMSHGIIDKTMTMEWLRQYSMANFPSWKFATILPSIPRPTDPRQPARPAAREAAAPANRAQTSSAPNAASSSSRVDPSVDPFTGFLGNSKAGNGATSSTRDGGGPSPSRRRPPERVAKKK